MGHSRPLFRLFHIVDKRLTNVLFKNLPRTWFLQQLPSSVESRRSTNWATASALTLFLCSNCFHFFNFLYLPISSYLITLIPTFISSYYFFPLSIYPPFSLNVLNISFSDLYCHYSILLSISITTKIFLFSISLNMYFYLYIFQEILLSWIFFQRITF